MGCSKGSLYQTVSPERLQALAGTRFERLAAILFILFAEDGLVHEEESIPHDTCPSVRDSGVGRAQVEHHAT